MPQVVDTQSAKEFMSETLTRISAAELNYICADLERKSAFFQNTFRRETFDRISESDIYKVLRLVFATRRKAQQVLKDYTSNHLATWIFELLYGHGRLEERFTNFCQNLQGLEDNTRHDLASEILHFSFPQKFWLWTRWMWDPKSKTGALPLVVTEEYDLNASTAAEIYLKVGHAVAFIHQVGEAAGFQSISHKLFGTDVYLSCVYVVYTYTVLRMRMTQEFNKVVPGMAEFSRRLLGVHRMEESLCQ